ncbi:MAG TPA: hypothetical protein VHS59_12645, partial [Bacillota bacterium]|nr:hypothetical protein [Bacillota bacterium]
LGLDQLFVFCEQEDCGKKQFDRQGDSVIYPVHPDQGDLEARVEQGVLDLAARSDTPVYYLLELGENPLSGMVLIKLMEHLVDRLRCLNPEVSPLHPEAFDVARHNPWKITDNQFFSLLEKGNYQGLLRVLNQNGNTRSLTYVVSQLIQIRNFNFSPETQKFINTCLARISIFPQLSVYRPCLNEMKLLIERRQIPFIKALYANCKLEYGQADFVDFLVRFLRLLEELVIFALGWDENSTGQLVNRRDRPTKAEFPPVKELTQLLAIFRNCPEITAKYPRFRQFILSPALMKLVQLKHQTIGGHGYQGVSGEVLKGLYPGELLADLSEAMDDLGIEAEPDYNEVLHSFLVAEYQRAVQGKVSRHL